ncbi:hypothetical protein Neosp_001729 [[Neocosmospora] mangrovei]
MFVYQGKLDWFTYAKDETFVIILPNGPVRVGDSIYLFSQWTKDAQGQEKKNWFQTIIVDSVTQTQANDVTFRLKGAWYSFEITTQGGYESLSVVMRNPTKGVSKLKPFQRIWKSEGELTGTTRIWTGKFNWMHFAKDEPAIFIVPDDFKEGKPILSLWQYTQDSAGKLKDPSFRSAVQKSVSGIGTDTVKFSYHSYYDIDCTWERKTDKLAVHVKEGGHGEDVGSMIRSAIIERQAHTQYATLTPPEPTPEKKQVEVRLPQPQSSLPRILDPLPFPKDIVETLAHTAAFVDQAGYLAKYAQDRFAALHADYHTLLHQLNAEKANNENLTKAITTLTADRNAARSRAEKLEEGLVAANEETDKLRKKVKKLETDIHDDKIKDELARKLFKENQDKLRAREAEVSDLKQQRSKLQGDIEALKTRNVDLGKQVDDHKITIDLLTTKADVLGKKNDELIDKNAKLGQTISGLEKTQKQTQDKLSATIGQIKVLNEEARGLNTKITGLVAEKNKVVRDLEIKEQECLKAASDLREEKAKNFDHDLTHDH